MDDRRQVTVTTVEQQELCRLVAARSTGQQVALRARMVLLLGEGHTSGGGGPPGRGLPGGRAALAQPLALHCRRLP